MDTDKRINNVDLAIQMVRQLQAKLFDFNTSRQDLFNETTKIIIQMEKAQKDINTNFDEISKQLTDMWNGKSSS
jgi:hypothetical protein